MSPEPRDYDREFTKPTAPGARIRIGYDRSGADITRFVVQLECLLDDSWMAAVRFDHDAAGPEEAVHDVTEEGLHMDVYREGEKVDTVQVSGALPAAEAFTAAEEHLSAHAEEYITRFNQWHPTNRDH